jgi:hypothetical protein
MSLISATLSNAPGCMPLALFGTDAEAVTRIEASLGTIRWVRGHSTKGFSSGFYVRVEPRPDWLRPFAADRCTGGHTHRYCAYCADNCAPASYWASRSKEGRT